MVWLMMNQWKSKGKSGEQTWWSGLQEEKERSLKHSNTSTTNYWSTGTCQC